MEDLKPKEVQEENKNESKRRGSRGELGASSLKSLYSAFRRSEGRKAKHISLKAFAHQIAENGTDEEKIIALDWFKHKAENKRQRS